MKHKLLVSLSAILVLIIAGCKAFEVGLPQEVTVISYPSNADVIINGEFYGKTPLVTELPRKIVHEVRVKKEGYNPLLRYFTPMPNDKSHNFVKFGISRDLGHYVDLQPRELIAELMSSLVPATIGVDPFERMSERALLADDLLASGDITPEEHKLIIEQIIEFFEKNL